MKKDRSMQIPLVLNTGNVKKQFEFIRIFNLYSFPITFLTQDIQEIVATPLEVVVHKASIVGQNVIVEDTSLDLEGHQVGINVKHMQDLIKSSETVGKRATWTSLMAFVQDGQVYVFEAKVSGTIVPKAGDFEFGFAQYFMPDGMSKTLGQERNDDFNARALCIKNMMKHKVAYVMPVMCLSERYELQL
jgi:XTP/dITP diphosphohydrolase